MATDWRDNDDLFESTYASSGSAPGAAYFDRRARIPVEELPRRIAATANICLSMEGVEHILSRGWVPVGPLVEDPSRLGVPLYGVERLNLMLDLERCGYSEEELAAIAREDEELVDELLEFGCSYDESDPLVVVHALNVQVAELAMHLEWAEQALRTTRPKLDDGTWAEDLVTPETVGDLRAQIQHATARRDRWVQYAEAPPEKWSPDAVKAMARAAFEIRRHEEVGRYLLWQWSHDQLREGFSPLVELDDVALAEPHVDWEATLKSPRFLARPQPVRLRIPGAVLEGQRVTPTRAMTPTEYKRFYERWDLGTYFRTLAEVGDRRICANCLQPLRPDADARAVYCGERCRNAAKGRVWRQNNPLRAAEFQRRFWSSLPEL